MDYAFRLLLKHRPLDSTRKHRESKQPNGKEKTMLTADCQGVKHYIAANPIYVKHEEDFDY
ncbi:MAG: hypothetical protein AB8U44_00470 [Aaplasma endosymbiont of Hyalomma asiaticum]